MALSRGSISVRAVGLALAFTLGLGLATASPRVARADDWTGTDKVLHFGVSAGIAGGAYGVSSLALEDRWARAAVGGGSAILVGAGKELYDLAGHGDPSWKDFAWDVLGALLGVGVAFSIDLALAR